MTARRLGVIDKDELAEIVGATVRRELEAAGLVIHDADHRADAREDFAFLRKYRLRFDRMANIIGKTILGAIITGMLALVFAGAKVFGLRID
jgi:hypothetical protein